MATHSRILAWMIPWTEEPGGLIFPYFPGKYLFLLKLVLTAGFALDIEFVLSSHQSTGRNKHSINKSNPMNKVLGGLYNGTEVFLES